MDRQTDRHSETNKHIFATFMYRCAKNTKMGTFPIVFILWFTKIGQLVCVIFISSIKSRTHGQIYDLLIGFQRRKSVVLEP
jgi:hypothetical protein